jgi:hypothetical protein
VLLVIMKTSRIASLVGVGALVGGLLILGNATSSPEDISTSRPPHEPPKLSWGNDLAQSLDLTPITQFPVTDCHYFAEARDLETDASSAYCLDGAVQDDWSFMKMAITFKGRVPTAIDERIFDLQEQLTRSPDDQSYDAQRASIAAEIMSQQAHLVK